MVKEVRDRCDMKNSNYDKVNNNFFQFQKFVLALLASVQWVYVPGGICPRG